MTRRLPATALTVLAVLAALAGAGQLSAQCEAAPRPTKHARIEHKGARPRPILIPQQFAPSQESYASFPEKLAGAPAAPPTASACRERLAKIAIFRPLPVLVGPGECGAADAVLLESVILPDGAKVPLAPPATLRCTMAEAVTQWVRDDVAPAALKLGAPLRGLENLDSYECRGRNRVRGATLSEHGRANALDVRAFKLANGTVVVLTDVKVAKDFRDQMRASACARFATVLGPGSDGAHEEHIHLDLAERRNNYKICEWDVRVPAAVAAAHEAAPAEDEGEEAVPIPAAAVPLPRPRPVIDAVVGRSPARSRRSRHD